MGTKAGTNGIDSILDFGVDGDDNGCVPQTLQQKVKPARENR